MVNARSSACAVTGVTCAAPPTRPFPRPGRGRQEAGHSPVGSDVSWTLGSPAVRSPGTTIGSAASYEQPAPILAYWAAPSLPDAVGARNGSQRVQTSPDAARCNQNLLAGEGLPVRLSPMVTDTPEFPDTEEVTGSNPVRPTTQNPRLARMSPGQPSASRRPTFPRVPAACPIVLRAPVRTPLNPAPQFAFYQPVQAIGNRPLAGDHLVQTTTRTG